MIKIIYGDVARGAAEGAVYTDTGKQTYADLLLSDGANPRLIATGEVGRWKLDGSVDLLGAVSAQYGYVSTAISGADGTYTGEVGINIALDGNYASTGLTITFDTLEDVAYSFRVEWYNGETKVAEGTFSGKGETTVEQTVPLYNAVRIRFLASDKPYRFARLQKIVFGVGRQFTPSDFDTISLTQEVSPISDDLQIDTSKFVLRPRKAIRYLFQTRQTFKIYRDADLIAAHYVKSAQITAENRYSVECQSLVGLLEEQSYAGLYADDTPALTIAQSIVDTLPFEMDATLQTVLLSGYIAACTRREALHQLLFALGAICTTADSEKIRIFAPPQTAAALSPDDVYTGTTAEIDAPVTGLSLTYHTLSTTKSDDAQEVTIGDTKYYDTTGTVTVTNTAVLLGTPENIVEITDATLVDQTRANVLKDRLAAYYFGGVTVTQKRLVREESLGDKVTVTDALGATVTGMLISRETAVTNLYASTCKIRGSYASD